MEDLNAQLIDAILTKWDLDLCRALIASGANVDAVDALGDSALILAARREHLAVCKVLLNAGADVNFLGTHGRTALHAAMHTYREDICRFLVAHGADVNIADEYGWTPFTSAANLELPGICWMLLQHGADQKTVKQGLTAFQEAVKTGKRGMVEFFIDVCGEDPAQRTENGYTMIRLARDREEVKALLRSAKTRLTIDQAIQDNHDDAQPDQATKRRNRLSPL